jgi:DNA polymerase-3 subunit alpha
VPERRNSPLSCRGQVDRAREAALEYKKVLGSENYYLEIQSNELPEQEEVNKLIWN